VGTQLELEWMRVQISLLLEIRLIIFANVMVDQGYGHNQGYIFTAVLVKNFE
jgi:hypothetical protein